MYKNQIAQHMSILIKKEKSNLEFNYKWKAVVEKELQTATKITKIRNLKTQLTKINNSIDKSMKSIEQLEISIQKLTNGK